MRTRLLPCALALALGIGLGAGCVTTTIPEAKPPKDNPAPPTVAKVPAGFKAAAGTAAEPYTKTGWAQEVVHEQTGLVLVYIPAGEFLMGSPGAEKLLTWMSAGRDHETQHRVTLTKGFYLGKYEVTQGQWEKVMGNNPSKFQGRDNPVERVSWDDCQEFCQKLGAGFRLPTEAEWEYACRAGTNGPYAGNLDDMAWYDKNSGLTTHPVGQKKPNAWGLYDMHGNVLEWCADWYGDYPLGAVTDPTGPEADVIRVCRGGSWRNGAQYCRAARRDGLGPRGRVNILGCRLAFSPAPGQ